MQIPNHIQEHIGTIAKHEQEFLARRSPAERLGDLTAAIVGNLGFVAAHILLFSFWIIVNTLHVPRISQFDPAPFSLLGTAVAMEAIYTGTHRGIFNGHPPSGKSFRLKIVVMFKFDGDHIASESIYLDYASQLRQLGIADLR